MSQVSIIYFSGYGHTKKQAEAIQKGASSIDGTKASLIAIDKDGNIADADWATIADSQAVIFGSPTYMGGPAWQFKKFADASSKQWFEQKWRDKVAAGFTNSASMNGDKHSTIAYFMTLSMQHSMVWIGTGLKASNTKSANRNDVNWLGAYSGAMAQAPADSSPDEGPLPGDLETASLLGARVATFAKRITK